MVYGVLALLLEGVMKGGSGLGVYSYNGLGHENIGGKGSWYLFWGRHFLLAAYAAVRD